MKPKNIGFQIKPVGSFCNIQCAYCYAEPFKTQKMEIMPEIILEKALTELAKSSFEPVISWHGGEPTLAGLDFYQKAMDIADSLCWKQPLINQIQTNATLINGDFARFFAKYDFRVGVSLDGPQLLHDANRVSRQGQPTFDKVMNGVEVLRTNGVSPSVTVTITKQHLTNVEILFDFLVESGFCDIRLSPVFDADDNNFNISAKEWGVFLQKIFDCWFELGDPNIHIRELEEVMSWIIGKSTGLCNGASRCANWISIDERGMLYPCEYFKADYPYGNILQTTIDEVATSYAFLNHLALFTSIPEKCSSCEHRVFCGNGCPATRVNGGKMNPAGIDFYCESKKFIFSHILAVFDQYLERGEIYG